LNGRPVAGQSWLLPGPVLRGRRGYHAAPDASTSVAPRTRSPICCGTPTPATGRHETAPTCRLRHGGKGHAPRTRRTWRRWCTSVAAALATALVYLFHGSAAAPAWPHVAINIARW